MFDFSFQQTEIPYIKLTIHLKKSEKDSPNARIINAESAQQNQALQGNSFENAGHASY